MIKTTVKLLLTGSLGLFLVSAVAAKEASFPDWTDFYGSASYYNGNLMPVGSVIDAYDVDGTLCGSDTVTYAPGIYGFMAVFGDEPETEEDEGALLYQPITFTINGRSADTNGPDDALWLGRGVRLEVNLSATALVSMEKVTMPADQYAAPGVTVRYVVTVKNTGQGLDFYSINCTSSGGWFVYPQPDLVYAASMEIVSIYFDVLVPPAIPIDTEDMVTFTVTSGVDPSVFITDDVTTLVVSTSAPDDNGLFLPEGFSLHQNYPNPFNPRTVIAFDLPHRSVVELDIYNVLGRQMAHFDLGSRDAGSHAFNFEADAFPSGIYFYRLKAGEHSDMKKMVLLK
ncbi:MAG: T9SS type A sorting domain-containing protein [Candidatus Zixiibacteriota bacterium]|nr:MAG: T9SS type A sorting domain-containing protein [candidate division Zixibacteria bacterium]